VWPGARTRAIQHNGGIIAADTCTLEMSVDCQLPKPCHVLNAPTDVNVDVQDVQSDWIVWVRIESNRIGSIRMALGGRMEETSLAATAAFNFYGHVPKCNPKPGVRSWARTRFYGFEALTSPN